MIKTNRGNVELKGSVADLLCELTATTKGMLGALTEEGFSAKDAKDLIDKAINLAFKSEEELRKEAHEVMRNVLLDLLLDEEDDCK